MMLIISMMMPVFFQRVIYMGSFLVRSGLLHFKPGSRACSLAFRSTGQSSGGSWLNLPPSGCAGTVCCGGRLQSTARIVTRLTLQTTAAQAAHFPRCLDPGRYCAAGLPSYS